MKNVTIEQAVKSMVPDGLTYGTCCEWAIAAVIAAELAGQPEKEIEGLKLRLAAEGVEEVQGALLVLLIRHAKMKADTGENPAPTE